MSFFEPALRVFATVERWDIDQWKRGYRLVLRRRSDSAQWVIGEYECLSLAELQDVLEAWLQC